MEGEAGRISKSLARCSLGAPGPSDQSNSLAQVGPRLGPRLGPRGPPLSNGPERRLAKAQQSSGHVSREKEARLTPQSSQVMPSEMSKPS